MPTFDALPVEAGRGVTAEVRRSDLDLAGVRAPA